MKAIRHYSEIVPTEFEGEKVRNVAGRVAIGKADGATSFCMRIFEIGEAGYTPRHEHPWEHEIFFHAGQGEVLSRGGWTPVQAGSVVFIPAGAEHQIRNTSSQPLVFVCLVPSAAPEL